MIVTRLKDLEQRIKKNAITNQERISNFQKNQEKRGLKKGRVRPRSIVEQNILNSFKRK